MTCSYFGADSATQYTADSWYNVKLQYGVSLKMKAHGLNSEHVKHFSKRHVFVQHLEPRACVGINSLVFPTKMKKCGA
jgi:hypothetical protein